MASWRRAWSPRFGLGRRQPGGAGHGPPTAATATGPPIEAKWLEGELGDGEFEDDFIVFVICDDIGDGCDGWEFPGSTYTIT
ncbi:hypothetical protein AB0I66_41685 [Streptomyces sp. NPDC050439]